MFEGEISENIREIEVSIIPCKDGFLYQDVANDNDMLRESLFA